MTKAVYTVITGDYDNLLTPKIITDGWNYLCFTDNEKLKSDFWNIIRITNKSIHQVKLARKIKILSYLYVSKYDLSVWVDGNIQINCDLDQFIKEKCFGLETISLMKHPERNCLYDEGDACIKLKKDSPEIIIDQVCDYIDKKFPKKWGLFQTGVIVRPKLTSNEKLFFDLWWREVEKWSRRDQISLPYISWLFANELGVVFNCLDANDIFSNYFIKNDHNKNQFGGKF